jgi:WD40 repeat protein
MLATTSQKGTVIRFFDCSSGSKLHEVRRGSEPAIINYLHFEHTSSKYLVCTSNKDTVHVFKTLDKSNNSGNTKSYFSMLSPFIPGAGDEWSYAQVKLPPREVKDSMLIASCTKDQMAVVSTEGTIYMSALPATGGVAPINYQFKFNI